MSEGASLEHRHQAARLAQLVHASHLFAEAAPDVESLLRLIAEYVAGATGDACTIRLLSEDGASFDLSIVSCPDDDLRAAISEMMRRTRDRADIGLWRTVVDERRTFRSPEPGEVPPGCSEAQAAFIRRYLVYDVIAAPLIARGRVLGGISLIRFGEGAPLTPDDEAFLYDLAERAALAIDNVRLYGESRAQTETLRAVVENAPDIISRFDRDLRHLYVNPAVERATGLPAHAMIGKSNRELGMPEPLVAYWEHVLHQVFRTGQERAIEFDFTTPIGVRHYQARIAPELNPDGTVGTALVVARDVTEQWRAAQERAEVYRELLERDRRLQELVSRLVLDRESDRRREAAVAQLEPTTAREREILGLIAHGLTNQQIGRQLGLSSGTVKNHVARLLEKLGVADRTAAAVRVVQLGLVETS
ncbi:MAG TPA: LuxR C-terminal-related transcriptional regulator [Chloroflexota bacterium]|nr:LuxR C-terminal-related transcriptional regulator [Chloroflexota bacterium]